jgi:large subunit ribosomal protein L2
MPSGELRKVLITCMATVGVVSNSDHALQSMGKAGRNRWKGIKPRNRGVAMNPVDHPMGGGEGRSSGGHPRSRTGKYAKGEKTRNVNKGSNKLIIQRRDGKKLSSQYKK